MIMSRNSSRTVLRWLVLATFLCGAHNVAAKDLILGGITFSDEDSSIVLRDGWGSGTTADPFVLLEDIVSDAHAVLKIRGLRQKLERMTGMGHPNGFALTKIVRNKTKRSWYLFELELREVLEHASTYRDGLSFAQSTSSDRVYRSDRFTSVWQTDEPLDAVTFSGAVVAPDESVSVNVVITDFSPLDEFYLIQRRPTPLALLPGYRTGGIPNGSHLLDHRKGGLHVAEISGDLQHKINWPQ